MPARPSEPQKGQAIAQLNPVLQWGPFHQRAKPRLLLLGRFSHHGVTPCDGGGSVRFGRDDRVVKSHQGLADLFELRRIAKLERLSRLTCKIVSLTECMIQLVLSQRSLSIEFSDLGGLFRGENLLQLARAKEQTESEEETFHRGKSVAVRRAST